MSLLTILNAPNPQVLDQNFYVLLESHLPYLLSHPKTRVVEVTGLSAEKYTGDFHGLLDTLAIDKKYHYLVTRMNAMTCSTEYDGKNTAFMIPDMSVVSAFLSTYNSRS